MRSEYRDRLDLLSDRVDQLLDGINRVSCCFVSREICQSVASCFVYLALHKSKSRLDGHTARKRMIYGMTVFLI